MLSKNQMRAVRATFGNDYDICKMFEKIAENVKDGCYTMQQVHELFMNDWGLCFNLTQAVNRYFSWANMSVFDMPQAIYDYVDELVDELC